MEIKPLGKTTINFN